MKLIINKNQLSAGPEQFLRRAGYGYIRDRRSGKESFVLRLGNYHYPRLHMYVERSGEKIIFNLHLDQKQASYAGYHMHNAEYDSKPVITEIERLRWLISKKENDSNKTEEDRTNLNAEKAIGHGEYDKSASLPSKKSWWRRIMGI